MNTQDYYGENYNQRAFSNRIELLRNRFFQVCGERPQLFFSSPGRAELIGNHTDHQNGKVIVSAITCDILCAVRKRTDDRVEIYSDGFQPISFCLKETSIQEREYGKSIALVRGVAFALQACGCVLNGFTAYTDSTIFRGVGVSSSAAFEVLICEIFNELSLNGRLSKEDKAAVAQYAENKYFGKPCGLLDQSGISYGGLCKIDFFNPLQPKSECLPPPKRYQLVLTNTGGSHANLTEEYAAIRKEMQSVASFFGKEVLGQVSYEQVIDALPNLRKKGISDRALLRALHFFRENKRVDLAADALQRRNMPVFLKQVKASGESSMSCLQNCYLSGSKNQPICIGIELSKGIIKNGAVRVHGGGFAGTIMAILSCDETERYRREMGRVFGKNNVFVAGLRNTGTSKIEIE